MRNFHDRVVYRLRGANPSRPLFLAVLGAVIMAFVVANTPRARAAEIASFDCRKATMPTEKLICSDPDLDLQWLDRTMAEAYLFGLEKSPKDVADALRQNQHEWLVRRDQECGIRSDTHPKSESERERLRLCLVDHYQKRNRILRSLSFHKSALSVDEMLALFTNAQAAERPEICPVSRDLDLSYYERIAAEKYAVNPIFLEIPKGLRIEEDVEEYRPETVTPERQVPSLNVPEYNTLNPHHGLGDSKMRIFCRVQDPDGNWWLAKKNHSEGGFTYFLASDMKSVSKIVN